MPYLVLRVLTRRYHNSSELLKTGLGILNCFSGGVFFSTSILSLLPEARHKMEEAQVLLTDIANYPDTELILGLGFLLILIIENVTISCHGRRSKVDENRYDIALKMKSRDVVQNGQITVKSVTVTSDEGHHKYDISPDRKCENEQVHPDVTEDAYSEGMAKLRNIILILALSIHMIFDGLELGLMGSESKVWSLLLALSIHKSLILFSLGLTVCESSSVVKYVIAMVYMSLISPVGVGIGLLLTSQGESSIINKASAVLQSFAVGTFIYVAFFEILLKEFVSNEGNRILKTCSTVFGFVLFAVIAYLLPG